MTESIDIYAEITCPGRIYIIRVYQGFFEIGPDAGAWFAFTHKGAERRARRKIEAVRRYLVRSEKRWEIR